ncbi:nuclear transport factor 2 family protein [Lutibacter sp.]|uniref:nuclear transport factor 2 family protein n=1 Tax=Lutibacter sp. TaxID=1925666 RepID=UPI00273287D0|nr:nuclear transport factor 2 family protein [Lutibacter sp.]MDP3313937.1 nuclear transport factor 2 family protein [Lutibacter sp.]
MKKLILLGLSIVLFSACNKQRYSQDTPEIETVKSLIENYNTKAYDPSMYADTSKTYFNTNTPILSSEVIKYHEQNDANYKERGFLKEGQEYEMVITDEGEIWVNSWLDWKGTLAANNKEVTISIHLTYQFIDGKIVREHGYWDPTEIVLALQEVEAAKNNLVNPSNVATIKNLYANFAKGDVPAVLATFDAKIVWNEAENFPYADGNPYIGPDAVLNGVFARVGGEWDYYNLVDIKIHNVSNDMVLATGRYQAKYKKNGAVLNAQMAHLWGFKDGKVISFQQFTDTKQADDVVTK